MSRRYRPLKNVARRLESQERPSARGQGRAAARRGPVAGRHRHHYLWPEWGFESELTAALTANHEQRWQQRPHITLGIITHKRWQQRATIDTEALLQQRLPWGGDTGLQSLMQAQWPWSGTTGTEALIQARQPWDSTSNLDA